MTAASMAQIIDGKAVAAAVRDEVRADAAEFRARHGRAPGLAVVLVGDDPASATYVRNKRKACADCGIESIGHELPATTAQGELLALVRSLNARRDVDGILVQLPLPKGLESGEVIDAIDPAKDVDGLHPISQGRLVSGMPGLRPCTPLGVMRLLETAGAELKGARAVVVGRSNLVGKPVAFLLLERHATLTICHSRTRDLAGEVRSADVLIAAIGQPRFIQGDWIKAGASSSTSAPTAPPKASWSATSIRRRQRARRGDHAGAGRGGADDHRHAPQEHRRRGPRARGAGVSRTPLYDAHRALGARMVDFAGWDMPVQYQGIIDEHTAVRTRAGLFDVSHMGEIELRGAGALDACQRATANDVRRLRDGSAQYSLLLHPEGGIVDDIIVHRLTAERVMICVNASNRAADFAYLRDHATGADVVDVSDATALLALQGPRATAILARCTALPLAEIPRFAFAEGAVAAARARRPYRLHRRGWWELYAAAADARALWDACLAEGEIDGISPAGLGARHLRLEAALPLYGHELGLDTSPYEARLGWVVQPAKGVRAPRSSPPRRAAAPSTGRRRARRSRRSARVSRAARRPAVGY
jgi:methylenetetrahydrofolate dehydrogenase (NADP+)/methenyltetrahydrofolate cyclohydrolase